ncbi:MAG: hypothetical protein QOJ36_1346 [Verrucomicrobiota bacterium]
MTNSHGNDVAVSTANHFGSWPRGPSALRFHALVEFVQRLDLLQTIGVLTLVLSVIFGFEHWLFQTVARICLLVFVLQPRSICRPGFWLVLSVAGTIATIVDWERTDNHKYLLDYWLWVLFIAHLFAQPEDSRRTIRFNARFFLCLVFLAASAQKLSSPSYRSGAMFEHYLYTDSRFTAFGKLIGIDPSVPDAVQKRIALLRSPFAEVEGNELQIPGSERARVAALVLTWWDVSLQLLIGSLLLIRRPVTDKLAHILLLFFIFTTYIPAPVFGFGWILAIMGFTLAKEKFPRIAAVYIICFVAILLYQVPWREWVLAT